jgi:hypothetical protein
MRSIGASVTSLGLARARKSGVAIESGCASFALALISRYRDAVGMVVPLARVLACPRAQHFAQHLEQRLVLTLAPRITLQLGSMSASTRAGTYADRPAPASAMTAASPPVYMNTLVQRIVERVGRVSLLDGSALTLSPAISAATRAPRVTRAASRADHPAIGPNALQAPRVLRRASGAKWEPARAAQAATPQADVPSSSSGAKSVEATNSTTPTRVPAHFDVDALADRVVRVIDKRLTAHRERFGRL